MDRIRNDTKIFLVLVPHRDVRMKLRDYSLTGAYSFPWAAPLAVLSAPLNTEELKICARAVREASLTVNEGKITAAQTSTAAFPIFENSADCPALFGPRIDLAISAKTFGGIAKITGIFSPPVIGCCLLPTESVTPLPAACNVSFRAAAVANMFWRPLPDHFARSKWSGERSGEGYKWKIGQLKWLAKV